MAAKVRCKKNYNIYHGYVEFKTTNATELCPVSNATCCEDCKAKIFSYEEEKPQ